MVNDQPENGMHHTTVIIAHGSVNFISSSSFCGARYDVVVTLILWLMDVFVMHLRSFVFF